MGLFTFTCISKVLLLTCLRIMDDHKDWETDVTSHPDRPIPRGLLMPIEVCRAIYLLLILLILDVMCTYFYSSHAAAVMLLACVVYQYLMWREFFIPQAMHASPLLAAITHQPLSMVYFAFFVASQWGTFDFVRDPRTWWWGLAMMSAGFSYEGECIMFIMWA
jgi:4-hydroxybenzoate polyprenyltransferase